MQLILPSALESHRDSLLATTSPFIRVSAQPERKTNPWDSKVGGVPYLPKSMTWPTAPDGTPLFFLAQINFAEVPALAPFPTQGIVQFFISDDDLYGMDFDDGENPDTFRVIFHENPVKDKSLLNISYTPPEDFDLLPHHPDECYPIGFALAEEVMPATDYQFSSQFGGDFFQQFGEQEWNIVEDFGKKVRADGHKIGGYAYFTQDDPRTAADPMLLLFQLDSDEKMDLMWGDMGIGHFFIREKDLLNKDFNRVLYDWDCL